MRVSALGRFEVAIGGRSVRLGGPQQRLTLALLVAQPNRFVPVDELIDGLWGEDLPGRPRKTLQVYIANLRRALGPQPWIASEPSGYRFAVEHDDVDFCRFEDLIGDARRRRAATPGAPDKALALYREALALWRGEPFADLHTDNSTRRGRWSRPRPSRRCSRKKLMTTRAPKAAPDSSPASRLYTDAKVVIKKGFDGAPRWAPSAAIILRRGPSARLRRDR